MAAPGPRPFRRRALALPGIVWLLALGACGQAVSPAAARWAELRDGFMEATFAANPSFAVYQGRHEFDGQLPDWSRRGIASRIEVLESTLQTVATFDPSGLDGTHQFERLYMLAVIDGELFWLKAAQAPFRNPLFYFDRIDPNVYLTRDYAPLSQRMEAYIRYAQTLPRVAEQIQLNLRTPLPKTFVDIARISASGLASYFEDDVPGVFAPVEDEALQQQFLQANRTAVQTMKDLDAWFARQQAETSQDYALGRDLFSRMLRDTEGVDISLEELRQIGERDLERNLKALQASCAQLAPGKSIPDCLDEVGRDKPSGGAVAGARAQLRDLKELTREQKLVSIPGIEEARVEEAPPYQRWNFAYIDIPGPYEEGLPSIYYIAPPDPSWTPSEQRDYLPGRARLLFTSIHEVWPGHFLQFLHSNRAASRFGQVFVGYGFAEGWAHYAEELMWEAGLADGDPATHIGQLEAALLRNARLLSAIGLHTEGMSVQESEALFRERGYQDPGTSRQQAARGTFDPAYLNYTMGKLMIRKLRQDWTASRGGRAAWQAFHDTFLSYGGPPIPLVRRAMLGDADTGTLF